MSMSTLWLEIELHSELCAANGDGTSGVVDIEIASEYGLPVIPAKRIKGCLREVALELQACGLGESLDVLFGVPGEQYSGALHLEDAHLFEIPSASKHFKLEPQEYESVREETKAKGKKFQQHLLDELTMLRTRTAIDEDHGSAADGSLRTMRVLQAGIKLRSRIELIFAAQTDPSTIAQAQLLLERCVKGLRSIGLGRTRGMGEVRCSLKVGEQLQDFVQQKCDLKGTEEIEVPFRLKLEQPVLIPGNGGLYHSSASSIPGSVLLGALAGTFIRQKGLGAQAHTDPDFARIFLRGGVKFGYALPVSRDQVFAPCPANWQRVKNEDQVYDVPGAGELEDQEGGQLELRSLSYYVYLQSNMLYKYELEKEVRMHHSRPQDRNYAHPKGPDRGVNEGQFFQYTSLSEGQLFEGTLRGSSDDLNQLLGCLGAENNQLRLGRSRTAEYGKVRFERMESASPVLYESPASVQSARQITICLYTPMVLVDRNGRAEANPDLLIEQLSEALGSQVQLGESRLKFGVLAGYNAQWRMPKPQTPVLEAGTTIVLQLEKGTFSAEQITMIESTRWGSRTGEGCGALRVLSLVDKAISAKGMKLETFTNALVEAVTSGFLENMEKLIEERSKRRKEYTEGREAAKNDKNKYEQARTGSTKLRQYWNLAKHKQFKAPSDKESKVKEKPELTKLLAILLKVQEKSPAFINGYFQTLIWEARNRNE
ncbi:RAMP superfamily CRISPR-associated protein [Saccharibacillus alkalitolerans]|uniref:CRISPR type III-associated protein domain-containing protein n=1 Tax=Saccharibacillus alkalitolerans TaxID=2705290 RepID=A0ABX0F327_9BACL|nr:RAMP superfamily CRISPR-associated protein [Saccharibacillus alkalitolerans]NGZ74058.1 hypothetical protein [Saccharibacillus alkalitolerans]